MTELLDGLEDEILWGMVYNFLEDAQRRAAKEGPEVNPTGGLDRKDITEALQGFLGQAKAQLFVQELFAKLKEVEMTDEALEIISAARKPEKSLSERVEREVRSLRDDRHDRERHGRERYDRERHRDRYERTERYERDDRERHRDRYERSEIYERTHREERLYRDERKYSDERRDERYRSRERDEYESRSRYHRRSHHSSRDASRERDRRRDERRSRIPSSNSPPRRTDSVSPVPLRYQQKRESSPGFERTREPSWERDAAPAPKAPQIKENIPSALEAALRERAKRSKNL